MIAIDAIVVIVVLALIAAAMSVRVIKQYERVVLFELGKVNDQAADPIRSVIAIENVRAAIDQIAQTALRAVVGRHSLDETLSETDAINQNIREIRDVQTEAEREKRAKLIGAQGEALAAGRREKRAAEHVPSPDASPPSTNGELVPS